MTWTDVHARTGILHEVLVRAAVDPGNPALLHGLPDCDRLFGGPDGVLAALQYRWDNHLQARLDQGQFEGSTPHEIYRQLAAEQPELRAVLDAHLAAHWQRPRAVEYVPAR